MWDTLFVESLNNTRDILEHNNSIIKVNSSAQVKDLSQAQIFEEFQYDCDTLGVFDHVYQLDDSINFLALLQNSNFLSYLIYLFFAWLLWDPFAYKFLVCHSMLDYTALSYLTIQIDIP